MAGCHFDILTMSKHYRYSVAVTIIMAILTCVSFILSITLFGFLGAAIASVTTIILHSLFVVIIVYSLLKILPVDKQTLQLGMVLLLIFILSIFLPSLQNSYLSILYKSSLLVCIYLPVIYILGISEDINQQIKRILNAF
jgi:O-antigen/teichoic acid export membrane protein